MKMQMKGFIHVNQRIIKLSTGEAWMCLSTELFY